MKSRVDASIGRLMERNILRVIADHGMVIPGSESAKVIREMYPEEGCAHGNAVNLRVTDLLEGMIDDGLLRPSLNTSGKRTVAMSRGLTTKGWERLDQLERPVRWWIKRQWFPLVVAVVTSLLAVASMVSTFLLDRR